MALYAVTLLAMIKRFVFGRMFPPAYFIAACVIMVAATADEYAVIVVLTLPYIALMIGMVYRADIKAHEHRSKKVKW
jgi:hypothetical protein